MSQDHILSGVVWWCASSQGENENVLSTSQHTDWHKVSQTVVTTSYFSLIEFVDALEHKQTMMKSTAGQADMGCRCVCARVCIGGGVLTMEQVLGSEWGQSSPRLQVWMKAGRDSATENPGSEVVATTLLLPVINSCFRGDAKICHVSKSHDGLLSNGGIGELEESLGELVGNAKAKTSLDRQLEVWALRGSRRGSGVWAAQELLYWLIHSDIHRSLLLPRQKKENGSSGLSW